MPGEINSPYRQHPFTGEFFPKWNEADEIHVAKLQESNGLVGFFLNEAPQLRAPSDFICAVLDDEYDEYGTPLRENVRLDEPDADEFRVDYDAEGFVGTGFVEVHPSRVNQFFVVGYWGLGTPPRWETHLRARVTILEPYAIAGDLEVNEILRVVDEYDEEIFSVDGEEISAHMHRIQDVADAVDEYDAINKGQADEMVKETAIDTAVAVGNAIHGTQAFTSTGVWTRQTGTRYVTILAGSGSNSVEAVIDLDAPSAPSAPFAINISGASVSGFGVSADGSSASLGALAYPELIAGRTQSGVGTWGNGSQGVFIIRW